MSRIKRRKGSPDAQALRARDARQFSSARYDVVRADLKIASQLSRAGMGSGSHGKKQGAVAKLPQEKRVCKIVDGLAKKGLTRG